MMWMKRPKSRPELDMAPTAIERLRPGASPPPLMDELEARVLLYLGPGIIAPPAFSALESNANTVVRVLTNLGAVDIELYDTVAPNTVNNFRNHINAGRIDESFFHYADNNTLRGGGFRFADGAGLSNVPATAPIANEFSRSNLARTVAMWKPDGQPNGATSQFFINLVDNPGLNTANGGYTVFGRVVQGWNVVQAIAALTRLDLDQPLTGSNPNPGTFDKVPVTAGYNGGVGPTEATIVKLIDIEAMKPTANGRFYENQYVYPEGFRGANTVERIDLVNIDDFVNGYQIIIRYETGDRDQVIFTGALAVGQRISLKINDSNLPSYNLVRPNTPYAIEVRSTRALTVAINRRDFNVQVGEHFVMAPRIAEGAFKNWNFGGAERGTNLRNFLIWENLSDKDIKVNVGLFPEGGSPKFIQYDLKAFRRGGVALHDLGLAFLPNGKFSIQVSATGPIVAGLSTYRTNAGGNNIDGGTSQGGMNGGGTVGYLAAAQVPSPGTSEISVFYSTGAPLAIVDVQFILQDGTVLEAAPITLTSANRRATRTIADMHGSLPTNTFFTVRYAVRNNAAPVTATYRAEVAGDIISTVFQSSATSTVAFSDGFTDPTIVGTGMQETISVFNPYINSTVFSFFYQLKFQFQDGTSIFGPLSSLNPWSRADIRVQDIPAVIAKINSGPLFRFYSVQVISAPLSVPVVNGGVIAQMTRLQNTWSQSVTSTPGFDARLPVTFLSHPEYGSPV